MESENTTQKEVQTKQVSPLYQVTSLSKYLALALFVILPFLGGWIGYNYAPDKVVEVERTVIKEVEKVAVEETDKITYVEAQETEEGYNFFVNKKTGLTFIYPETFTVIENDTEVSLSSININFHKYDDKRGSGECNGWAIVDDEISIEIRESQEEYQPLENYEIITIGENEMMVERNYGAMCGNLDLFRWEGKDGLYTSIVISNSDSQHIEIAEKVLATLKYVE
jgi:hypothetical protein